MDAGMHRIGDDERDRAAERLAEHLQAGRITVDEHADRVSTVFAARTQGELERVFSDLPAPTNPEPSTAPVPAPGGEPDLWQRLATVSGALATVVFLVLGFAFGGWAWAWVVFLLPGAFAAASSTHRDDESD